MLPAIFSPRPSCAQCSQDIAFTHTPKSCYKTWNALSVAKAIIMLSYFFHPICHHLSDYGDQEETYTIQKKWRWDNDHQSWNNNSDTKIKPLHSSMRSTRVRIGLTGGERGIWTLGTRFSTYTRFPIVLLQPLGHLSGCFVIPYFLKTVQDSMS